ncbi:hypothetical protein PR048_019788 [Dryococelus australis]|uniref:Uncharacterized protein n=1 Tax=Dryococelus australis TaxID=614101 RepID=A0ABQ9H4G1_9NEOP|nr:hypothetical protein PR048_019788 [Dryococelus australis]
MLDNLDANWSNRTTRNASSLESRRCGGFDTPRLSCSLQEVCPVASPGYWLASQPLLLPAGEADKFRGRARIFWELGPSAQRSIKINFWSMAYDPINIAAVQRSAVLIEAFWLSAVTGRIRVRRETSVKRTDDHERLRDDGGQGVCGAKGREGTRNGVVVPLTRVYALSLVVWRVWKLVLNLIGWGRGGVAVRLLGSHLGESGSIAGRVASGTRALRRRWSTGFLGDIPSPRARIPVLLHTHLASPSSSLETPLLSPTSIQSMSRHSQCSRVIGVPSRTVGFTRRFHTLSSIHATNTSPTVVPQSPVVVHTSLRSRTLG